MAVHIYSPDYGCSSKKVPCAVCGYEYDPGKHYLSRPCPVCGVPWMDATSYPELVRMAVSNLIHFIAKGRITRRDLARRIGVSVSTLKGWEYRKCSERSFKRFQEGIKKVLNELGAYDKATDPC